MGQAWTADEDALLLVATSMEDYQQRGGLRAPGQVKNRRQRLKDAGYPLPNWTGGRGITIPPPSVEEVIEPEELSIGFRNKLEDEDTRDYWEAQKQAIAAAQRRVEKRTNRTIPYVTEDPDQPFGIIFFGDTHLGSSGILAERLERELDLMRQAGDELGVRLVFMGDAIENAKVHGKAAPAAYEQAFGPSPQIEVAEMLFGPLSPYFIAFLEGNHDSRDAALGGIGWTHHFAKRIGVPFVSEAGCAIHLTHGFQRYTIYARHDWRGKSQINKANSLRRFWQEYPEWDNADVGVLAHLHEPLYESVQQKGRRVHWIRTGSVKVFDAYAERGGFTPEPGVGVVIFWPNQHRIQVSLDLEEGIAMLEDARRRHSQAA